MFAAMVSALATFGAPALLGRAQATTPSIDCRKAITTGEKTICSDPALVALDRKMARRFQALVKQLDKDRAYHLTLYQYNFIADRDEAVEDPALTPQQRTERLRDAMQRRLRFLNAITPVYSDRIEGTWISGGDRRLVLQQREGGLHFHFTLADPFKPGKHCEDEGLLKNIMPGGWDGTPTNAPDRYISINLVGDASVNLDGQALSVFESPLCLHSSAPACGACPGVDLNGSYFRVAHDRPID